VKFSIAVSLVRGERFFDRRTSQQTAEEGFSVSMAESRADPTRWNGYVRPGKRAARARRPARDPDVGRMVQARKRLDQAGNDAGARLWGLATMRF